MPADEAVALLADLPTDTASGIFREMDYDYEEKVKGLLEYEKDRVGGLRTTQFMALKEQTIVDALNSRHANEMEDIYSLSLAFTLIG